MKVYDREQGIIVPDGREDWGLYAMLDKVMMRVEEVHEVELVWGLEGVPKGEG